MDILSSEYEMDIDETFQYEYQEDLTNKTIYLAMTMVGAFSMATWGYIFYVYY